MQNYKEMYHSVKEERAGLICNTIKPRTNLDFVTIA